MEQLCCAALPHVWAFACPVRLILRRTLCAAVRAMSSVPPGRAPEEEEEDEELEQPQETDPSGRFVRLAEVLGAGAFKTVYKGVDLEKGTEVAWNKLRPGITEHDFRKLYEEVRLLEHLVHDRIINFVHSWIDAENQLVFITEYMTSGTLKQYLKTTKRVKLKVIKEWCKQILEGLAYLHSHEPPIIHRDIKCDNVFINGATCEVKIGDLGLATVTRQDNSMSVIGTPEFMAPEFYTEHYDSGVDIWAFGLTMLEMITGECPYAECQNIAQIFRKVSSGQLPVNQLDRIDGQDIRDFICLCLSRKESRPSAAELLAHPFLTDQSDENSNKTVVLRPATDGEATSSRSGEKEGHFVILNDEETADVVVVDTTGIGENNLQLILQLNMQPGGQQEVSFEFNLLKDTADAVSAEMVKELSLKPGLEPLIANLIREKVDVVRESAMSPRTLSTGASGIADASVTSSSGDSGADSDVIVLSGPPAEEVRTAALSEDAAAAAPERQSPPPEGAKPAEDAAGGASSSEPSPALAPSDAEPRATLAADPVVVDGAAQASADPLQSSDESSAAERSPESDNSGGGAASDGGASGNVSSTNIDVPAERAVGYGPIGVHLPEDDAASILQAARQGSPDEPNIAPPPIDDDDEEELMLLISPGAIPDSEPRAPTPTFEAVAFESHALGKTLLDGEAPAHAAGQEAAPEQRALPNGHGEVGEHGGVDEGPRTPPPPQSGLPHSGEHATPSALKLAQTETTDAEELQLIMEYERERALLREKFASRLETWRRKRLERQSRSDASGSETDDEELEAEIVDEIQKMGLPNSTQEKDNLIRAYSQPEGVQFD